MGNGRLNIEERLGSRNFPMDQELQGWVLGFDDCLLAQVGILISFNPGGGTSGLTPTADVLNGARVTSFATRCPTGHLLFTPLGAEDELAARATKAEFGVEGVTCGVLGEYRLMLHDPIGCHRLGDNKVTPGGCLRPECSKHGQSGGDITNQCCSVCQGQHSIGAVTSRYTENQVSNGPAGSIGFKKTYPFNSK